MTKLPKDQNKDSLKSSDRRTAQLEEILRLMQKENLQELEICDGPFRVKLARQSLTSALMMPLQRSSRSKSKKEIKPEEVPGNGVPVKSPLAGVFYIAPSPQAEPFVKEGDLVTPEKTVCIVEAMKVLNQINAGVSGRVVKISVENGKPVQSGQVLFLVEPQE